MQITTNIFIPSSLSTAVSTISLVRAVSNMRDDESIDDTAPELLRGGDVNANNTNDFNSKKDHDGKADLILFIDMNSAVVRRI